MATRVHTNLVDELQKYGAGDWNRCFHCGNCTANCPLTESGYTFPRKDMRKIQMGLKEKVTRKLDPWLCYYCGDCSDKCPQDANPAEMMMTLRRYLTSSYDWTGLSKKFYTSKVWELGVLSFVGIVIIALFALFLRPDPAIFSNPEQFINAQGGVMINSMVQNMSEHEFVRNIEYGDWAMALLIGGLLITNIFNMFLKTVVRDKSVRVPLYAYFTEAWRLVWGFLTQYRFSRSKRRDYWLFHLLMVTGYSLMFTLIVALLPKFQIEEIKPWYNWQRLLGYWATFALLLFVIYAFVGRLKKKQQKFRFSHPSDWLYLVMLGLTALTGIILHFFRLGGMPVATYFTYVIHLAIMGAMLIVEVPFSKWSHLAYRPFALYFSRLKKAGRRKNSQLEPAVAA